MRGAVLNLLDLKTWSESMSYILLSPGKSVGITHAPKEDVQLQIFLYYAKGYTIGTL